MKIFSEINFTTKPIIRSTKLQHNTARKEKRRHARTKPINKHNDAYEQTTKTTKQHTQKEPT